jgi:hypothetical protein
MHDCPLRLIEGEMGGRSLALDDLALPDHVSFVEGRRGIRDRLLVEAGRRWSFGRQIVERGFEFDGAILETTPPVTLHGYFQSWRYFQSASDELRGQLGLVQQPSRAFTDLRSALASRTQFTAVQVRRGDYLRLTEYHGLASDAYMRRALTALEAWGGTVVIFADDETGWVPDWIDEVDEAIVIRPSDLPGAHETIVALSWAPQAVISNSSFGWWGAWLSDTGAKRVIAPRPWFAHRHADTRDLLPPHWMTVDIRAL